jgi:predicted nicotinamide N-methyase
VDSNFIRENTKLLAPPLVPEIKLHLAHEALPLWEKTEEELRQVGLPPPFWAFAWAGGQALARYLIDHPQLAANKTVLDFAAGSGLVGIAAAKTGASGVTASEIDATAILVIAMNAVLNKVRIEAAGGNLIGRDHGWDLVLVGDGFYEKPLADRLLPWLHTLRARGADVLIGDPGRAYFPRTGLTRLATYEVPVTRDLEDSEIKKTSVWRL